MDEICTSSQKRLLGRLGVKGRRKFHCQKIFGDGNKSSRHFSTYKPSIKPFTRRRPRVAEIFTIVPSMKSIFVVFWSHDVLRRIVHDINRNAEGPDNGIHANRVHPTKGGMGWFL